MFTRPYLGSLDGFLSLCLRPCRCISPVGMIVRMQVFCETSSKIPQFDGVLYVCVCAITHVLVRVCVCKGVNRYSMYP